MAHGRKGNAMTVLELPDFRVAIDEETADKQECVTGIVLGRLIAFDSAESALVSLKGRESSPPIRARRIAGLVPLDLGREVALMFEHGDTDKAMIIGCIEPPPAIGSPLSKAPLTLDAETIVLKGDREIVFQCGEASITLRRDGRVVVRGAYVETRSAGVNRIKGGSVQIN